MSEVQNTALPVEASEPTLAATNEVPATTAAETAAPTEHAAPVVDGAVDQTPEPAAAAPVEESKDEATPAAEKTIEPISEGQLTYKGPGLLK